MSESSSNSSSPPQLERLSGESDAWAVGRVFRNAFRSPGCYEPTYIRNLMRLMNSPNFQAWGFRSHSERWENYLSAAACIYCDNFNQDTKNKRAYIDFIGVNSPRNGVGSLMMKAIAEVYKQRDCAGIDLRCEKDIARFYEKAGFVVMSSYKSDTPPYKEFARMSLDFIE